MPASPQHDDRGSAGPPPGKRVAQQGELVLAPDHAGGGCGEHVAIVASKRLCGKGCPGVAARRGTGTARL
ncbi:hypothetical protein GCM10022240_10090 [Microbacterium kribbense]|uniref:Uncharacterized protein n=1 Tax=Microbacterium kribbense TaxID=433645 RepID=A0ABP7GAU6_9MICO